MPVFLLSDLPMLCTIKQRLHASVLNAWFSDGGWTRLLMPLSLVFNRTAQRRKERLLAQERWEPPVPVIVVGNITVGGTGKTPVVATLVQGLQSKGYRPGIVSRGFGAKGRGYPRPVTESSAPADVGDEPLMLAKQLNVPVVVDPNRVRAAQTLCEQYDCNLIIADDGLQHYNLKRHVELLVIDGKRMLGNGWCLPAGPLRESPDRLQTVDVVLSNGTPLNDPGVSFTAFSLIPEPLKPVCPTHCDNDLPPQKGSKVHGVAGIGHPERFFSTLSQMGFDVIPHAFPDHHPFRAEDLQFHDGLPVIMTAKDAVKCASFATQNQWYLPVTTDIPSTVIDHIVGLVEHSNVVKHG